MLKKHRVTITLDWASLNRDVQDRAYRMARLAKLGIDDDNKADKLESELTLTDEDMSLLKRAMSQGLAEVVTMCREYVWSKSHQSDNHIIKEDNLTIILMMPLNFNLAGCLSIGHAIHAYIVGKAMFEWYSYTVPARAAEQMTTCAAARKEIETILNARVRPMRSGQSLEVIVGEETGSVTMYYYTSSSQITEIPTAGYKTTTVRRLSFDATEDDPVCVAVALPQGYTPSIGSYEATNIGTQTYNGTKYTWWTTKSLFTDTFVVAY